MEIWETKPPGTLWTTRGLVRDRFTFTFIDFLQAELAVDCYTLSTYSN